MISKQIQELRDKNVALGSQMTEIVTKGLSRSQEDNDKFDNMSKDYDANEAEIRRLERVQEIEAREAKEPVKEVKELTSKEEFRNYLLTGKMPEKRAAQQSTTVGSGGYTIPTDLFPEIEKALLAYGGMWQAARVVATDGGGTLNWPMVNDTSNVGYFIAEAGNHETSATAITTQQKQFGAYKYTSGLIRVSSELLQDSAFDWEMFLRDVLTERVARALNTAFTTGAGTTVPEGVVIGATNSGVTSVTSAALTYAQVVDIFHTIDPLYRDSSKFYWMMNDSTIKMMRKITDSTTGRPLWEPAMADGNPGTILGKPYIINQAVAAFGSSAKSIVLGDFSKYIIRLVKDIQFKRTDERFIDTDEVGFVCIARVDGKVLDAGTNPLKYVQQQST